MTTNFKEFEGKWCVLTEVKCRPPQVALAVEVRPSGMRFQQVGIVPHDEYRLATNEEVQNWLNRP